MKIIVTLLAILLASSGCKMSQLESDSKAHINRVKNPDSDREGEDFRSFGRRMACIQQRRQKKFGNLKRAFHLKIQGCLKGKMTLNDEPYEPPFLWQTPPARVPGKFSNGLKKEYKVGVFNRKLRTAGTASHDYEVWARITNINQTDDTKADIHGFALKVMNVAGKKMAEKMLSADPDNGQDFLMNDVRTHFLNSPTEVVRSTELTGGAWIDVIFYPGTPNELKSRITLEDIKKDLSILKHAKFVNDVDEKILNALQTSGLKQISEPQTLISREYHSRAQFALGRYHLYRYFVEPCEKIDDVNFGEAGSLNPKRSDMIARSKKNICFMLKGQVRDNPIDSNVKDKDKDGKEMLFGIRNEHTLEWPRDQFPVVEFAKLEFSVADNPDIDSENHRKSCEKLKFNPFFSLEDHAPIGVMNHGRYHIYKASAEAKARLKDEKALNCDEIYPAATRPKVVIKLDGKEVDLRDLNLDRDFDQVTKEFIGLEENKLHELEIQCLGGIEVKGTGSLSHARCNKKLTFIPKYKIVREVKLSITKDFWDRAKHQFRYNHQNRGVKLDINKYGLEITVRDGALRSIDHEWSFGKVDAYKKIYHQTLFHQRDETHGKIYLRSPRNMKYNNGIKLSIPLLSIPLRRFFRAEDYGVTYRAIFDKPAASNPSIQIVTKPIKGK